MLITSVKLFLLKVKSKFRELIADEFYRSILQLLTGTSFAKFFPFVFALGLARIYSPDQFGEFVFELTIASILSIIATAQYENAIILPSSDLTGDKIFAFGVKLSVYLNGVFLLVGLVIIQIDFSFQVSVSHLVMIILYSQFFSILQFLQSKLTRQKRYKTKASLEITRSVMTGAGQFLFFLFPEWGLIAGAVIGQIVPVIFYAIKKELPSLKDILAQTILKNKYAIRYIDFPKFMLPGELLNFVSSQLPILVFKPLFGSLLMGYYSFSHRYISIPIQLISKSVSGVLVEKATNLRSQKNDLSNMVFSLFKRQFLLGIIPFSILGLWGKEIFSLVFGKEWEQAGVMAQLLAPWLFAVLLGSPLSSITTAFEKQKFSMFFNILFLLFRMTAIFIGYYFTRSVYVTVLIYSLVGFLFFNYLAYYTLNLADVPARSCSLFVFKTSLIILIPLIILKLWL
jgi:O-antigen/teichoic acid export membrane protein